MEITIKRKQQYYINYFLILLFLTLRILDILTTVIGVNNSVMEINPFMRGLYKNDEISLLIALNLFLILLFIIINYTLFKIKDNYLRRFSVNSISFLLIIFNSIGLFIVLNNYHQINIITGIGEML